MNWLQLAQEVVEGKVINDQEASSILNCEMMIYAFNEWCFSNS